MTPAKLGQIAPSLSVSAWVQGEATNFDRLRGRVVLVEVFQVNCPGCFLYCLPRAIDLYRRYSPQGLVVLGLATAFEDFDKNTLSNLRLLLETGEVIGETLRTLTAYGQVENGRWAQKVPFPVAMDRLIEMEKPVSEQAVQEFIRQKWPAFSGQSADYRKQLTRRVSDYLQTLDYRAETFERFDLQGTPSHILVDKRGMLRACRFGEFPELESGIRQLIAE
ncbi:TlpA family protein disulfide reductase [Methylomonas sp. MgM2]